MTRPARTRLNKVAKSCALVLEGNEVKHRLEAERLQTGNLVHVDWLRFTCSLRNAPMPDVDHLFPPCISATERWRIAQEGTQEEKDFLRYNNALETLTEREYFSGILAFELATQVACTLGEDYVALAEMRKGHDFYRYRWSIERCGHEVGWVGFLASSDSPRQKAQRDTLHVNLWGSACTFADSGWRERLADLIDEIQGKVTRVDLALDFFEGLSGGIERIKDDYMAGLCNVYGKRPKCNMVGDWCNGCGRSFYIGSKGAGKQTNFYEKGYQLFGEKDATNWLRAELRYGNKLRILSTDMLRAPQDYFAGASDYHAALLREAQPVHPVVPEAAHCHKQLAEQCIEGEVTRNIRWLRDVAASSISLALQYLDADNFVELFFDKNLPRRLSRFSLSEVKSAYQKAFVRTKEAASAGPAFAPA